MYFIGFVIEEPSNFNSLLNFNSNFLQILCRRLLKSTEYFLRFYLQKRLYYPARLEEKVYNVST
jgi:hypothetical protein